MLGSPRPRPGLMTHWEDSQDPAHVTPGVIHPSKQTRISKGSGAWGKVCRKAGARSRESPPSGVSQDGLHTSSKELSTKLTRDFFLGAGHEGRLCLAQTDYSLSGAKEAGNPSRNIK